MTILAILMAIVNAALFFLYGKEHKRRIALEDEVADRKPNGEAVRALIDMAKKEAKKEYDINKLLEGAEKATKGQPIVAPIEYITPKEAVKRYGKPKAMTAPIVKSAAHPPKPITPELNLPKIPRGYKRHDGGKCPLKRGTRVDVIYRDGLRLSDRIALERDTRDDGTDRAATHWEFLHNDRDIIAYKVVKPKTMKRGKK